jgi:peptidoglycan hydrolase-like protein with peptidoglycan-binding domain
MKKLLKNKVFGAITASAILLVGFAPYAQAQVAVPISVPVSSACVSLTYNMEIGSRDVFTAGQVSVLQNYLNQAGYMHYPATGYYGTLTFNAVRAFQAANGISQVGLIGPLTRAKIQQLSCGNGGVVVPPLQSLSITSMTPTSGDIGTRVTVNGYGFAPNDQIKFGSGAITQINFINQNTISFTVPEYMGQYCTPGQFCTMIAMQVQDGVYPVSVTNGYATSNALNFYVNRDNNNDKDAPRISSLSPSNGRVGTSVTVRGDNLSDVNSITFSGPVSVMVPVDVRSSSRLTFEVPATTNYQCFVAPCNQQSVIPGTYQVTLNSRYGTSNAKSFTVTGSSTTGSLSIIGIDAPTSLPVYTSGTWTVRVNNPSGNYLHYSVVWGDEGNNGVTTSPLQSPYTNNATFTHTYQQRGIFAPRFTVTDDYGHLVTTSATVSVY